MAQLSVGICDAFLQSISQLCRRRLEKVVVELVAFRQQACESYNATSSPTPALALDSATRGAGERISAICRTTPVNKTFLL